MHINYDDSTRQYKYRSVLKKKKKKWPERYDKTEKTHKYNIFK